MSETQRLTGMDEYPRHQTSGTFNSVASDSANWSDGFYFTLGDSATGASLFVGLRLYTNTDVIDGFACVTIDGRQHNVRWSRRLRPAIDDISVGPFALEIIEPLKVLRLTCAENEYGISFDITWNALHEPYLEDEIIRYTNGRRVYARNNYDQAGDVTGSITVGDRTIDVNADTWVGVRDHSWGLGRTGGKFDGMAPEQGKDPRRGFAMRQWTMIKMPDRVMFWQFHQQDDGSFTPFESIVIPNDTQQPWWAYTDAAVTHERIDGLPRVKESTVALTRPDGGVDRFLLVPVGWPVYLQGGGYHDGFNDHRGRGVYRGEEHSEGESWDVTHPIEVGDPTGLFRQRPDAWAEQFATCVNLDDPTDTGFGHQECVLAP